MRNKLLTDVIMGALICLFLSSCASVPNKQTTTAKAEAEFARSDNREATEVPTKDAEEDYRGSYIRRPTLMVHNMDDALSLYRDILGLRVGRLSEDGPDSYVYTAFNIPTATKVMHATLDTDKGVRVLSLIEVKSMQIPDATKGLRRSATLVNANGRLEEIRRTLITRGYTVLPTHALGASGTEFGFIDKDGHLIVLYEFKRP